MITKLAKLITRLPYQHLRRAALRCYPDATDRANGLLAEGAELVTIELFAKGNPLKAIVITPSPYGGYIIHVEGVHDTESVLRE
jgi:hypothetical protein